MPTGLHETIIGAVKTMVQTIPSVPTVKVREQMFLMDEDTLPLIVLTMGAERPAWGVTQTEGREYEVFCTIWYAQNQILESGYGDAKGFREAIRQKLVPDNTVAVGSILTGVSAVWDCEAVDLPSEDVQAFRDNYEEARLGLVYRTSEVSHA